MTMMINKVYNSVVVNNHIGITVLEYSRSYLLSLVV